MPKDNRAKVKGTIRCDTYSVLSDCIENGVSFGINRTVKYMTSKHMVDMIEKTRGSLTENLEREIMNAICEKFNFGINETDE